MGSPPVTWWGLVLDGEPAGTLSGHLNLRIPELCLLLSAADEGS